MGCRLRSLKCRCARRFGCVSRVIVLGKQRISLPIWYYSLLFGRHFSPCNIFGIVGLFIERQLSLFIVYQIFVKEANRPSSLNIPCIVNEIRNIEYLQILGFTLFYFSNFHNFIIRSNHLISRLQRISSPNTLMFSTI